MKRMSRILWVFVVFGSFSVVEPVFATLSVGTAQGGKLLNGFELPQNNAWIRFYSRVATRGSNYATLELAALLTRASRVVRNSTRGPFLTIGDCSSEDGGDIRGHKSHNSGRDVDILFYIQDKSGRAIPSKGFWAFDGNGKRVNGKTKHRFDVERNWWLVRTLLVSEKPSVQYIFVSSSLKKMMLDYAKKHGEAKEILQRARYILMQPRDSSSHNDHFHVRVYCSTEDRRNGCKDTGPVWSWVKEKEDNGI